jgi:signal transduction histidine kinase
MKTHSITRRLIGGVLAAEFLCIASFAIVATAHEMHGRRRGFDVMLRGRADSLLGAVHGADPYGNLFLDVGELAPPAEDIYVATTASGIVGHSQQVPPNVLTVMRSSQSSGFFNFEWNGRVYRAFHKDGVRSMDRESPGIPAQPIALLYASPTNDLEHEEIQAFRYYATAGGFLLIITGFVLIGSLRLLMMPLHDLAKSARRVSTESWDFSPPEAVLRARELAPIANSIKRLLIGLQRAFERQRQFTGDAAHELKTSVALLKSRLQLLTMRKRTAEQYEEGAQELLADMQRIQGLIEQMLTLARVEEAPQAPGQEIDLSSVVKSVTNRLQPLADVKKITISMNAEAASRVAMESGDAGVLVSNLLLNALQHSPPESLVSVSVRACAEGTELRVADQGEGISDSDLPHVFERFYRADASRSRQSGGAGLGLAICKAIVERAHGNIKIQSQLERGTEVTATFPVLN